MNYWYVAWGDSTSPTFRGLEKSDLETACKRAYGMVAPTMLAIDLGTRVGPTRSMTRMRALHTAVKAVFPTDRGVFRWNWQTLTLEKLGPWSEHPWIDCFHMRIDLLNAQRPVAELIEG